MLTNFPLWFALAALGTGIVLMFVHLVRKLVEHRRQVRELRQEVAKGWESEQRYRLLFELNPNPMWVFDEDTLRFLAVNQAAIQHYGYSREEFLAMDILSIRPAEEEEELKQTLDTRRKGVPLARRVWRHRKRSGEMIQAEVSCNSVIFDGRAAALVAIKDVTEVLRAEEARQTAHETLEAILEASPLVICAHDLNGRVQFGNPAITKQLGWTAEDLIGKAPAFIRQEDVPFFRSTFSRLLQGECMKGIEWLAQCKDGSVVPYSIWTAALRDAKGNITGVISAGADLRERKKAEALEQDRNRVLEMVATNRPPRDVLRSVEAMVERQFPGHCCVVTLSANPEGEAAGADAAGVDAGVPILSVSGQKIGVVELTGASEGDEPEEDIEIWTRSMLNMASRLSSIAIEHGRIYEKLEFDARHDSLTGLPNRLAFEEALGERMAAASEGNRRLAVLFLDLDRFKQINDSLGHRTGDQYLQEVARRLSGQLRPPDLLFRLGGDEFVVLLYGIENGTKAENTACEILAIFDRPIQIEGLDLFGKASVGISVFPDDSRDAETLKQHADSAMYRAKHSGGHCWRVYKPGSGRNGREDLEMERALHRALEENRLEIHYQPQYRRGGELAGVEALLRYRHPEKGLLLPGNFIGIAEETGLIVPIGISVLEQACRQSVLWQESGLPPVSVAVNVSPLQITREDFADLVASTIERTGIRPELLALELTESALMDSSEESVHRILRLRALGVRFSIDDFGTGFSSLSYLHRLPIDELKIDRSFVQGLEHATSTLPLVEAILAVGRSMGLEVVAEGVENARQLELLRGLGCPTMQGFYLGRPVAAVELETLLAGTTGSEKLWAMQLCG